MKRKEINNAISSCFTKGLTKEGNLLLAYTQAMENNTALLSEVLLQFKSNGRITANSTRQGILQQVITKSKALSDRIEEQIFIVEEEG